MDQGLLPAPHGLSQVITSFIASCCQGIHQTPLSRLIRPGKSRTLRGSEAVLSRHASWFETHALVSVLDLDSRVPRRRAREPGCRYAPTRAHQHATDVYLSKRGQFVRGRTREGTKCPRGSDPPVVLEGQPRRKPAQRTSQSLDTQGRSRRVLVARASQRTHRRHAGQRAAEGAHPQNRDTRDQLRKELVERIGIEPMTPCLQSRCSPS